MAPATAAARRGAAVLACALACAAWPASAHGAEATGAEVRVLAAAAQRDPAALERLRAIDVVDGRPAPVGDALRGDDAEVRARLRVLAEDGVPAAAPPADARGEAREVLAQRRFRPTPVPAPLRSVRERIGEAVRSIGRPFEDAFAWVAGWFPGGGRLFGALLGLLALAAAVVVGRRVASRRAHLAAGGSVAGAAAKRASAARLRREAEHAERRGDLDLALRLRFRAGLVELDERELIELRPALTNHELLRALPSPTLAGLVDDFEGVAYGGRPADPDDVRSARDGWPRVADEVGAR